MDQEDPLAQLRDIHLPEAVGLWPLAPGWWLLLMLGSLAIAFLVWYALKRKRAKRYRTQAEAELEASYLNFQRSKDTSAYIRSSQEILRRTALYRYADRRANIAPLYGSEWIHFLDSCINKQLFSTTFGEALNDAHYQRTTAIDAAELHRSALYWLRHHE